MENPDSKKSFINIQVSGESESLWKQLRHKLILTIDNFLDATIDYENNSSIRDEARKLTSALIDNAKGRLKKPGLENEKLIAEIDNLYLKKEREIAETRKINAQADELEFRNALRRLRLSLGMAKAMMLGEPSEENLLLSQQLDAFIEILNEEGDKKST